MELGAGLAAIGGIGAGQVPTLTARRLKESTLTRSRSMRPVSPSSSSRAAWSCSNTPARAHSSKRRQQVVAGPQPQLLGREQTPGGGGAGHEHQGGDTVAVRDPTRHPAARTGWWRWQQWLDPLPELIGEEPLTRLVMPQSIPRPARTTQLARQAIPECPLMWLAFLVDPLVLIALRQPSHWLRRPLSFAERVSSIAIRAFSLARWAS
jgi:hypothetical protein